MKTTTTYFNDGSKKINHYNGAEYWYDSDGVFHRADGPALIFTFSDFDLNSDSETYMERKKIINNSWFWHGKKIEVDSQEKFRHMVKLLAFI